LSSTSGTTRSTCLHEIRLAAGDRNHVARLQHRLRIGSEHLVAATHTFHEDAQARKKVGNGLPVRPLLASMR
jgi:hypothetical protein